MKLPTLLVAFGWALPITTLTIDPSLPNGVYYAHPDPSSPGRALHKRFVTGDPKHDYYYRSRTLKEAVPIANGRLFCRDGAKDRNQNRTFDLADYHAAINALFEAPLFWVPDKFVRYALHGSAVVYVCNLSKWNRASLLEFMDAMADADARCGEGVAAKRTMAKWDKWYGRDARGFEICKFETHGGGIPNDLMWWEDKGCENYVNGIERGIGDGGKCNDNAVGEGVYEMLRKKFPWYKTPFSRTSPEEEENEVDDLNGGEGMIDDDAAGRVKGQDQKKEDKNSKEEDNKDNKDNKGNTSDTQKSSKNASQVKEENKRQGEAKVTDHKDKPERPHWEW